MASRRFWKIDSNEGASVLTVRAPEGEVILLSGLKLKGAAGDAIPDASISQLLELRRPKKSYWGKDSFYRCGNEFEETHIAD